MAYIGVITHLLTFYLLLTSWDIQVRSLPITLSRTNSSHLKIIPNPYHPCMVRKTYIWLNFMVNVGNYTIHGWYRKRKLIFQPSIFRGHASFTKGNMPNFIYPWFQFFLAISKIQQKKTPTKPPIRTPGKLEKKRCHLTTKKTGGCSTLILLRPFARTIYPSSHNHGSEKLGPSNSSFLSFGVVFHFHDYARKGPGSAKNGPSC